MNKPPPIPMEGTQNVRLYLVNGEREREGERGGTD